VTYWLKLLLPVGRHQVDTQGKLEVLVQKLWKESALSSYGWPVDVVTAHCQDISHT